MFLLPASGAQIALRDLNDDEFGRLQGREGDDDVDDALGLVGGRGGGAVAGDLKGL